MPRAGMQNGVPACMSLVLACRMTCTRPYPRAGLHIDVHACAWDVQAFRGGILGFETRCMLAVLMCTCSHFSTLGEQPPLQTRKARLQANNCHCKPRKRDCRQLCCVPQCSEPRLCPLGQLKCAYADIFSPSPSAERLCRNQDIPRPFIFRPLCSGRSIFLVRESFHFELILIGRAIESLPLDWTHKGPPSQAGQ